MRSISWARTISGRMKCTAGSRGEIREIFRKAALQHEAARGLGGDDWARYQQIMADHGKRCRDEHRDYDREYQTRVEHVRRRLVDEAGSKRRIFVPRGVGRDTFNSEEIDRQAHRAVHADHLCALAHFEARKEAELNALFAIADKRLALGRKLKEQFEQASDPRSAPDHTRRRSR